LQKQRQSLQAQIDGLLKPSSTPTERKQADVLLSKLADIRGQEERQARLDAAMRETRHEREENQNQNQPEHRAAKIEGAFKAYVRTGDSTELRTYAPLSTAGVPVPQGFAAAYFERLKSFSGIREAGATTINTTNGDPLKNPFSDDTANTGERLQESDPVSLANPTLSNTVLGAFRYAGKGLQYSAQLQQDSGIDTSEWLSKIFSTACWENH